MVGFVKIWDESDDMHGNLEQFDGLLLHPNIREWAKCLSEIPQRYPNLRYAIASHGLGEYLDSGKVRAFDFSDADGIFEYFFGERKASSNN